MMSASKQYVSNGPNAAPSEFLEIAAEAWWSMHYHWLRQPELSKLLAPVGPFAGARLQPFDNGNVHTLQGGKLKPGGRHPLFQRSVREVHLYDSLAFIVRGKHAPYSRLERGDDRLPFT